MSIDFGRSRLTPWAGWICGPLAWVVHQQAGADLSLSRSVCANAAGPVIALGVVCAVVSAAGGLVSWSSRGGSGATELDVRGFVVVVGAMAGGLFLLAILFQVLAGLIVPPCHA